MLLEIHKIFTNENSNFVYDSIRGCYRGNKKDLTLKFKYKSESEGDFFLGLKYNSLNKPNLIFSVNNHILTKDLLKNKTESYDRILSLRAELGPFKLKQGLNLISLECEGVFPDIYSIEVYKKYGNLELYRNIYSYKISDFVLLECYNLYGGFYWHLNNYMIMCYFCDKYRKIPVVNFTSSTFINNSTLQNPLVVQNNNWFFNYFNLPIQIPPDVYNTIIKWPIKKVIDDTLILKLQQNKIIQDNNSLLYFDRASFKILVNDFHKNDNCKIIINKYFKFLDHITEKVNIVKGYIMPRMKKEYYKLIGIHYRGTDKISERGSRERDPKHLTYDSVYELIETFKKNNIDSNLDVFYVISTDEQPFIDYFIKKYGRKVLYYDQAYRSKITTSGIDYDFSSIPPRNYQIDTKTLNMIERQKYNERELLINNSIHMGSKNENNYKKGLDCLIDTLIMDECDFLFKSEGNFSMFCKLFNKNPNLKVYEMNNIL